MSSDPIEDLRKMRAALVATRRNLAAKGERFVDTQAEIDAIDRALADEEATKGGEKPKPPTPATKRKPQARNS